MSASRALASLIVWFALAGTALAGVHSVQEGSTIRVRVPADVSGSGAVTVTVQGEDAPDRAREETISPSLGLASITGIAPGTIALKVDAGNGRATTTRIVLGAREVVTLIVEREPTSVGLRIRVASRVPLGEGVDFDERWLGDLPAGRDLWSLIETTAPYVIADRMDTGGIGLGRSAVLGARGASWTSTTVRFGEVNVLLPDTTGLIPIAPDMTAVTSVSVTSGLDQIEADTPGVLVTLIPKTPGRSRRGSVEASFTDPRMADDKALPDAPPIASLSTWRSMAGQVSLPLSDGRGGVLVSATAARAEFFERNLPGLWRSESGSILGHLISNPSTRDQLRVTAALQRVQYPYEFRRQFEDRNVSERSTFLQTSGGWHRMADGLSTGVNLSLQRAAFRPRIPNSRGGTVDRVTDGVVPAPAASTVANEWQVRGSIAAPVLALGFSRHEFRAGLTGQRASASADVLALPIVAEQVAGIPARVWIPSPGSAMSERTRWQGALYAADRLTLGSSLSVEAGVRADIAHGSAQGSAQGITWRAVSPRGSFHWARGRVSIFGGAGLYSEPLALHRLAFGDPGEPVSDVYRWHDLNNNRRYDDGERGVLVSRHGWGSSIATIDPDFRAPRTYERTIGLDLRLGALTFRSAAIWRDQTNLMASVNTGVPFSAYRTFYILDQYTDWDGPDDDQLLAIHERLPSSFGKDSFLLTNPDGEKATYEGLEFTWNLTTRRLVALFGVTAYRTRMWSADLGFGPLENDHGVLGNRLENPNAQPVVQGSYFFDRSYVGKLAATYHAPGGVRLAFSARYQDGQPFSRVIIAPDLAGGAEMIHAYRIGRTRFTYTLTLDVRVAKDFSIAGRRSSVYLDVFNATRHLNEVEENVLTTPIFRKSTAMQPPLAVRVGFRIAF